MSTDNQQTIHTFKNIPSKISILLLLSSCIFLPTILKASDGVERVVNMDGFVQTYTVTQHGGEIVLNKGDTGTTNTNDKTSKPANPKNKADDAILIGGNKHSLLDAQATQIDLNASISIDAILNSNIDQWIIKW